MKADLNSKRSCFIKLVQRFPRLTNLTFLLLTFSVCISMAQQAQPATHMRFNDDTGKLQFAIISDLWGSYRSGVFEDAIDKLELLQPQFVMSVGDLIDGKIYDSTLLDQQWSEFNVQVNSLSMPFFYVPGNHDISNPWMEREWNRRYGKSYYYFIHNNVLFLCINTQDGGASGIHEEQITYFKKAIEDHPNVRWTFVFMHRPVWQGEGKSQEGYEKIEAALDGRYYTLFSGHHHTYLKLEKHGNNHYVLGSTGGGSALRGEKFGEFDHIAWVTLINEDPPKIINIKLDGMIWDDVVNEKTLPITTTLTDRLWLETPTHVSQKRFEDSVCPVIFLNNPTDYPLSISGNPANIEGYSIEPQRLDLIIPPRSNKQQVLTIRSADHSTMDLALLPFIGIELSGSYKYDNFLYEIPARKKLLLDWRHVLPELPDAEQKMMLQFEHPDTADFLSLSMPEYLSNSSYWHGPEDCMLRFKMARDKKYLYGAVLVDDDQLVMVHGSERDLIYVHIEDKNGGTSQLTVYPDPFKSTIRKKGKTVLLDKDIQLMNAAAGEGSIRVLFRLPIKKIARTDNSFRLNIGYRDQDKVPFPEYSVMYWKPLWESETDYPYAGTFILKNKD